MFYLLSVGCIFSLVFGCSIIFYFIDFIVYLKNIRSRFFQCYHHFTNLLNVGFSLLVFSFAPLRVINFFILFFFCLFAFSRATPATHGGSQARGPIGAVDTGLHQQGHSNVGSEPCLQPTPELTGTPDPQPSAQGQGWNLQRHGSQLDSLTPEPRWELQIYFFSLFDVFHFLSQMYVCVYMVNLFTVI